MPEIPKGIIAKAAPLGVSYALLILLDGFPYVEFMARKQADFLTDLAAWKRKTYPSLVRSQVRFFTLAPTGEINELVFTNK